MFVEKARNVKWLVTILIFVLSLATIYFLKVTDRFFIVEQQILADPQFNEGSRYWKHSGESEHKRAGGSLAFSSNTTTNSKFVQSVPTRGFGSPTIIMLSLTASTELVIPADRDGAGGGVLLVYFDDQDGFISGDRVLLLNGSHKPAMYSHIEFLREEVKTVDVVLRLSHAKGYFMVSDPVLSVLQESQLYQAVETLLLFLWAIMGMAVVIIAIMVLNWLQLSICFLLACVAILGVLLPEQQMTAITQAVGAVVSDGVNGQFQDLLAMIYPTDKLSGSSANISKIGHFMVFTGIGLYAGMNYRNAGFWYAMVCVVVFALMTEALQMFVVGRTTSAEDLYLDCIAGLLGVILGSGLVRLKFKIP